MIIPSIDIVNGNAIQLIGGKVHALDAGDPRPIAQNFGIVGDIAVIDLDAAKGVGSNESVIGELCDIARCRVGGGIRSAERAIKWLDRGAQAVILGTAATPEVLRQLPKDRVIAALDAVNGEIQVNGWQVATGVNVFERMMELRPFVSGFLITTIEREGQMVGADFSIVERLRAAAGNARITLAGGIATADEISKLDAMGIDAQVGMALYTGAFDLADAIAAMAVSDRADRLIPTVVVDERGTALGLVYSDLHSIRHAITKRRGVFASRTRGLWEKGLTSGNWQELLSIDLDCDRDALRFTVRQHGEGFCHNNTLTCWGSGHGLTQLDTRIQQSLKGDSAGSYSARVLRTPGMLANKLLEEAKEFTEAVTTDEVLQEAADVIYFLSVGLASKGLNLSQVERVLDKRALRITKRSGDMKIISAENNA